MGFACVVGLTDGSCWFRLFFVLHWLCRVAWLLVVYFIGLSYLDALNSCLLGLFSDFASLWFCVCYFVFVC